MTKDENWELISHILGYPKSNPNVPAALQQTYKKYLHTYELFQVALALQLLLDRILASKFLLLMQADDQKRKVDARMTANSRHFAITMSTVQEL